VIFNTLGDPGWWATVAKFVLIFLADSGQMNEFCNPFSSTENKTSFSLFFSQPPIVPKCVNARDFRSAGIGAALTNNKKRELETI
jgi:hypothetical protein